MLTSGVVLLIDDAHPHTALRTQALMENFNWVLFDHVAYSPDLSKRISAAYLLKNWLESQRFSMNKELMEVSNPV
jgi:hypothetical protein